MNPAPAVASPRLLWLLLALAVVALFWATGSTPLFDLDEGAFTEATREMFERGDFISTYLNGVPRFDKPILIYWLQAAAVWAFGVNEFAFRLPSVLAATGWVAVVGLFVRRVATLETALTAALITATVLMVTVMGKAATADSLLNVLLAAATLSAYLHLREGGRRWLYIAFALVGLGFLTKGPVAVLVPAAVTFLYCASRGELRLWLRTLFHPGGIALFLAIAAPWYVLEYIRQGDAFIQGFFFKHNIGRFSSPMESHGGGFLYYVPVLLVGLVPYTALLLKVFGAWRTVWRDELQRFMLLWFLFVFVFFSLSGTKLPHYLNYGYTGLFVLMALQLPRLRSAFLTLLPALLFLLFAIGLEPLLAVLLPSVKNALYRNLLGDVGSYFTPLHYAGLAAALALVLGLMVERRLPPARKLLVTGVACGWVTAALLFPLIGNLQQAPIRDAAVVARDLKEPLVMWGLNTPSFSVYVQRVVPRRRPEPGEVVLTRSDRVALLGDHQLLYHERGVALVRVLPEPVDNP